MKSTILIYSISGLAAAGIVMAASNAAQKKGPIEVDSQNEFVLKTLFLDASNNPKEITVGAFHGPSALKNCELETVIRATKTGMGFWCMKN